VKTFTGMGMIMDTLNTSRRSEPRTKMKVEDRIDQVMEISYGPIEAQKTNHLI